MNKKRLKFGCKVQGFGYQVKGLCRYAKTWTLNPKP